MKWLLFIRFSLINSLRSLHRSTSFLWNCFILYIWDKIFHCGDGGDGTHPGGRERVLPEILEVLTLTSVLCSLYPTIWLGSGWRITRLASDCVSSPWTDSLRRGPAFKLIWLCYAVTITAHLGRLTQQICPLLHLNHRTARHVTCCASGCDKIIAY